MTGISWAFREGFPPRISSVVTYVFNKQTPLSLRSDALALTLPGFAGEECLPLPRSKGEAFPFLLTLGGYPTASANVGQGQLSLLEGQETGET
jgi:hypothetical protein